MVQALIGLGSNLGNRAATLQLAVDLLGQEAGITVLRQSRWIETRPIGGPLDQPPFLNGAVLVETSLQSLELLHVLQQIENQLGRQRTVRWGPRTIDLDLLLFGDQQCRLADLELPHPRMAFRSFVLVPAAEIAAELVVPGMGKTIAQLLAQMDFLPNVQSRDEPPHSEIQRSGG